MTLQYPAQAPEDFLNLAAFAVDGVATHLGSFGVNERGNGVQAVGISQRTQDVNGRPMFIGRVSIPLIRGHEGTVPWGQVDETRLSSVSLLNAYQGVLSNVTTSNDLLSLAVYSLLGFASHYRSHLEQHQVLGQRFIVETDMTQDIDGSPVFIGSTTIVETAEAAGGGNHWEFTDSAHLADFQAISNVLAQFVNP